jgi:uncharacterized OsmC-like protein
MDSEELRALQRPLKERYRTDPAAARVTLRARGRLEEGVAATIEGFGGPMRAGLHPATGGTGDEACSGDILLQALAACAGVTLRAVATALGVDLKRGEVLVEGDVDFRGTLGVEKTAPVGFEEIRLRFVIDEGDGARIGPETLEKLLKLTERYCVVYQTLRSPPRMAARIVTR